jgi:signal transduction histidine kinase
VDRALAWMRTAAAVRVLDGTLVAGVFALGIAGHVAAREDPDVEAAPLGVAIVVLAAMAATLLWWRRRHPLGVLAALIAVAVVAGSIDDRGLFSAQAGVELVVVCFAIGAWSTRTRLALAVTTVVLVLLVLGALDDGNGVWAAGAFGLALVALPVVAGYAARARRLYVEQVERRLAEAERDRDARARRAIEEERTRIARELHDVVAHHVSLIGVQAGAARTALDRSPEATRAALAAIEASSRDAVGEMRQLLDVLRPVDGSAAREPQPGLSGLPALVARWRDAGYEVVGRAEALESDVTPTVALACYRIVEESLANVARHSCARRVELDVVVDGQDVALLVADPGPARVDGPPRPDARGLRGMAERAALCGGRLEAGPDPAGGFRVSARLPRRVGS